MKLLTAIKLINWHYFINETIQVNGSALFTGDNGSGKSTILDAMQYILVADMRNIKFNVSAHDETKRDLLGYLRCKTGNDSETGQKYRRTGDITSYIVLEFHDTVKDKSFLIGAVIDSYSDGVNWKSNFFKIEDCSIDDSIFFEKSRPRNIKEFKNYVMNFKSQVYATADSYKADLLVKLGSLGERFFSLFVKAISFKPITDIRSFVYSYVLDEKSINIEVMKENFKRYKDYSELVKITREKIGLLEEIRTRYKDILLEKERALTQDYLIRKGTLDDVVKNLDKTVGELTSDDARLLALLDRINSLNEREEELSIQYNSYRDSLAANTTFQVIERLEREISSLEKEHQNLNIEKVKLAGIIKEEIGQLERFRQVVVGMEELSPEIVKKAEKLEACLRNILAGKDDGSNIAEKLEPVKQEFLDISEKLGMVLWELKNKAAELEKEQQSLISELRDLRDKKFKYDPKVVELRALIKDKLREKTGKDIEPAVLCELLEVKNEKWQDGVEGFLNTQRFDLIVDPQHFDYSLSVYEKYKRERRISGVGLVNTAKVLEHLQRETENSLAEEVISSNRYAKAYVNQLMGNVIKCENEQQLKNFNRSITPTCMTYMNNTARQINFKVYEIPYIGERAFSKQIEKKEQRLVEVTAEKENLAQRIQKLGQVLTTIKSKEEPYFIIKDKIYVIAKFEEVGKSIQDKQNELKAIDTSDIDDMKRKIEEIEKERKKNKEELGQANQLSGELKSEIRRKEEQLESFKIIREEAEQELSVFCAKNPQIIEKASERYEKEIRNRTSLEIVTAFTIARKGIDTTISKKQGELLLKKNEYNSKYHFWARAELEDIDDYEDDYRKLIESELPEYEEKINIAEKEAEEEFKEHFIYKLKENITTAKNEFEMLNDALKDIEFGSDKYRFIVGPELIHKKFYDMIMDEELFQGRSLFDTSFKEKHKEAMDELFEKIIEQPEFMMQKSIAEYTDYRTFLDYDIKITHANKETSTFSKVCREKSGGETQTPYYVAIVASFCQLYRVKTNKDSIRLMMFDEAFNRMDSDRIENSLKFMNSLGMQIIIAAPSDKCEFITPYVPTTMLAIRDGHYSWIEDYKRMKAM